MADPRFDYMLPLRSIYEIAQQPTRGQRWDAMKPVADPELTEIETSKMLDQALQRAPKDNDNG